MFSQEAKFRIAIAVAVALLVTTIIAASATATAQANPTAAEILPGTVITNQNWQQYRAFMSEGLIALFEGSHFWHMPAGLKLEVGPTGWTATGRRWAEPNRRDEHQDRELCTCCD